MCLEPKWPLFWLEKAFFWRVVSPQNRGQTGSGYIFMYVKNIHTQKNIHIIIVKHDDIKFNVNYKKIKSPSLFS